MDLIDSSNAESLDRDFVYLKLVGLVSTYIATKSPLNPVKI